MDNGRSEREIRRDNYRVVEMEEDMKLMCVRVREKEREGERRVR